MTEFQQARPSERRPVLHGQDARVCSCLAPSSPLLATSDLRSEVGSVCPPKVVEGRIHRKKVSKLLTGEGQTHQLWCMARQSTVLTTNVILQVKPSMFALPSLELAPLEANIAEAELCYKRSGIIDATV